MSRPPMPPPRPALARTLGVALAVAATGYVGLGSYLYVSGNGGVDFPLRWKECRYVARGIDPLGVMRGEVPAPSDLPPVTTAVGYPPWSYAFGAVLAAPWLPYPAAAAWFGAVNLLAWAVLAAHGWWAAGRAELTGWARFAVAAGGLTLSGVTTTLQCGNYGLVVPALLATAVRCLDAGRPWAAGVCLGLAMVKPQLAALFFLIPLVRRQYAAVVVAGGLVLGGWAIAAGRLGVPPVRLLTDLFLQGSGYQQFLGLLTGLRLAGVPNGAINLLGIGIGGLTATASAWALRRGDVTRVAAVAGTVSLQWMYHNVSDHPMNHFLAVLLLRGYFRTTGWGSRAVLLAGAVLVWAPYPQRFAYNLPVAMAFHLGWVLALVAAVRADRAAGPRGPSQ